jgi:hypothetical protein
MKRARADLSILRRDESRSGLPGAALLITVLVMLLLLPEFLIRAMQGNNAVPWQRHVAGRVDYRFLGGASNTQLVQSARGSPLPDVPAVLTEKKIIFRVSHARTHINKAVDYNNNIKAVVLEHDYLLNIFTPVSIYIGQSRMGLPDAG